MSEPRTYVVTGAIKEAVSGRETEVLDALRIRWRDGRPHIRCPYPDHGGEGDWRWDSQKRRAFCTCGTGSIFDVVMKCEGVAFEDAKLRIADLIGRSDLIRTDRAPFDSTSADSLLATPDRNRDDGLVGAYLAHRLGVNQADVLLPSTPFVGIKELDYFDPPPAGSKAQPKSVGRFPCAVFGMTSADGGAHAHRIYLAPGGAGKAELGACGGVPRNPKKSARKLPDDNVSGRSVLWGDPAQAKTVIVAEGVETAAAIAFSLKQKINEGAVMVAAAIAAAGMEAFEPWPAADLLIIAADRDELAKPGRQASRRGEQAARSLAIRARQDVEVRIALPGAPGTSTDWLDVLRSDGPSAVADGLRSAQPFEATPEEEADLQNDARQRDELQEVASTYPLPNLTSPPLIYARAPCGRIKVHKHVFKNGVLRRTVVSTPFGVAARLRYPEQADAYGLRLVVQKMDGEPRFLDLDRATLGRMGAGDTRSNLYAAGLRIEEDGEQVVLACLKAADPADEILLVKRPGWHSLGGLDPVFVAPSGEVVGALGADRLELALAARIPAEISLGGSLEGWKKAVAAAVGVTGCPHWTIGVVAGFAGSLIDLADLDTCGFNLSGMSSSGKTTAQKLAASVWARPVVHRDGLFQTAKATVNSMEIAAARASGTVLVLDELAHVMGRELGRMIYTFAGGAGKRRMTADALLRPSYSWSTFVLMSSESSLEEKIRSDNGEWTAGMAARIIDIDVTGVDRKVDRDVLDAIAEIDRNFGHAGPAFVRALIAGKVDAAAIRTGVHDLARRLAGDGADSALLRAALPFGILSMAGELATRFGLLPHTTDIHGAASWAWSRYVLSRDGQALDPAARVIEQMQQWIAERWDTTLRSISAERPLRDALGWYDSGTIYLPSARLVEAAGGGGLKELEVARILTERGLLTKYKDNRRASIGYVPGVGPLKAYALSRDAFGPSAREDRTGRPQLIEGGRL